MNRQLLLQKIVHDYSLGSDTAKEFSMFLASYKELTDVEFIRKFRETYPWLELMQMSTQNDLLRKIAGRIRWLIFVAGVGVAALVTLVTWVLCLVW